MVSLAVVIAITTVRLMSDGHQGVKEANFAMETGNRALAAAHLEDAAKAYIPGSPYPKRALRELSILARAAEIRGELMDAIGYWETVRRSIIATRHIFQPNSNLLKEAEQNLVRIRSDAGPLDLSVDLTYRREDPSALLSVLIFFGLLIWITGAVLVVLSQMGKHRTARLVRAYPWLLCLSGLTLWILSAACV
jgi:hypothetical protein